MKNENRLLKVRQEITRLKQKRIKLGSQLEAFEEKQDVFSEIYNSNSVKPSKVTGGKKPVSILQHALEILKMHPDPLSIMDISTIILEKGYPTNFKKAKIEKILIKTLPTDPRIRSTNGKFHLWK